MRKLLKSEHRFWFDKSMTPTKTRSPKKKTEERITQDFDPLMMIILLLTKINSENILKIKLGF